MVLQCLLKIKNNYISLVDIIIINKIFIATQVEFRLLKYKEIFLISVMFRKVS